MIYIMYKEYTCFIYSLYISRTSEHALKSWKLWSVGKTFSGTFSPHQNYIRKPVGSVIGPWLSASSPPCQGKHVNSWAFQVVTLELYLGNFRWTQHPGEPRVVEHEKSPGVLGIFGDFWGFWGILGDLHKAVLGFAPCFPWSCWKSQAFPNHLGIQGALFDPTWSVQTGGRRRRMLRPWQPREFASSFTTPFRKILHFFGGRDVPLKSNEWKIPLNSHPKPWFLVWFVRISGITCFLQSTCANKSHNHCPTPTVFMVLPMLILSLLVW